MIIPARFNGPPTSANGGWVAGALAQHVGNDSAVTVTLKAPPPLDMYLDVETTGTGVRLKNGDVVVAEAQPADSMSEAVPTVEPELAAQARQRFLEFPDHPFRHCFVCGTERPDGLQVYPGPVVAGQWTLVAAPFAPPAELAGARELLWAALDCPGGWAGGLTAGPALLATYTVQVHDAPAGGEPCVVVGQDDGPRGKSGRAHATRSAAYGADGRLLGRSDAVWVSLR